jgi:hypothetical protein
MKTFSIDYRSPPSGLGQIINTDFPPTPDHMILISYNGCGMKDDPNYSHTIYIDSPEIEDQGWIGPQIPFLFQLLKSFGIEKVYDSELGFEYPDDCDSDLHFKLQDWIDIMKTF